MTINLDEISKLLGEITQGDWSFTLWGDCISIDSGDKRLGHVAINDGKGGNYKNHVSGGEGVANASLIAAAPTIIKELVERVRVLENVAAWAREVVEDGEYDVKFECKDEAPIQSELLLNLERALSRLKEST